MSHVITFNSLYYELLRFKILFQFPSFVSHNNEERTSISNVFMTRHIAAIELLEDIVQSASTASKFTIWHVH